jgi:hypothetical protein
MKTISSTSSSSKLRLLPAYTGASTIVEALEHPRTARRLWLEILVNDELDLDPWSNHVEVQEAYKKACRWCTAYRSLLGALLRRSPLPLDHGPIDSREYRTFAEAIRFAAPHK